MTVETRTFHVGDILTVTTGRLVSPRHVGGVYDILNWMTGEDLMTHQLPRAMRECEAPLLAQHPDLADIEVPDGIDSAQKALDWLATLYPRYGETRPVARLDPADHTHIDPITELRMMNPTAQIIPVEVEPPAPGPVTVVIKADATKAMTELRRCQQAAQAASNTLLNLAAGPLFARMEGDARAEQRRIHQAYRFRQLARRRRRRG